MAFMKDNSTGAMAEIHKLLLNTLYGRLGINDSPECIKIVSNAKAEELHLTHNIIDNFSVGQNKEYIRFHKRPDKLLCLQSGVDFYESLITEDYETLINTSSAVATAIASWSRIIMYLYIVKSHYTDTDSVFLTQPLNKNKNKG